MRKLLQVQQLLTHSSKSMNGREGKNKTWWRQLGLLIPSSDSTSYRTWMLIKISIITPLRQALQGTLMTMSWEVRLNHSRSHPAIATMSVVDLVEQIAQPELWSCNSGRWSKVLYLLWAQRLKPGLSTKRK